MISRNLIHSDSGGDWSIPPLQVENDMIQDDNKKAELFNDYFCKQADLNDSVLKTGVTLAYFHSDGKC
jgi:hypothetical protein